MTMLLRSLLFVPADRHDRVEKALSLEADALIIDLEDSVMPERKAAARTALNEFLQRPHELPIFVRINATDSDFFAEDVSALIDTKLSGIVIPKFTGQKCLDQLKRVFPPDLNIIAQAAETPCLFPNPSEYAQLANRLLGLTWGVEDLASSLTITSPRDDRNELASPLMLARNQTLLCAHAANAHAIETVYSNFRDIKGLAQVAQRARRDGFNGMLAIHPNQLDIINAAFTPSEAEINTAKEIVDAFSANTNGAVNIGGKMYDLAHLKLAERTVELGKLTT